MRPELTGCIQLPTGTVKLDLTPATQALIWRCHFSPLAFVFLYPSLILFLFFLFRSVFFSSIHNSFRFLAKPESKTKQKRGKNKKKHHQLERLIIPPNFSNV